MKWQRGLIGLLMVTLLLTNGWWLYREATSKDSSKILLHTQGATLSQVYKTLPALCVGMSKDDVISRLVKTTDVMAFEKEGVTHLGHLAYTFDEQGRLVKVAMN